MRRNKTDHENIYKFIFKSLILWIYVHNGDKLNNKLKTHNSVANATFINTHFHSLSLGSRSFISLKKFLFCFGYIIFIHLFKSLILLGGGL